MLRSLSAAATAGMLAVLGLGLTASPATAESDATASSGWERDFDLKAKCKPDRDHALLVVINHSDKSAHFLVKKADDDKDDKPADVTVESATGDHDGFSGKVDAHDEAFVKVPWKSEKDTWKLFIKKDGDKGDDKNDHKFKFVTKTTVGKLDRCKKDDEDDKKFSLRTVCKPDDEHVKLKIVNDSKRDEDFELKKKDGDKKDETITGTVKAHDSEIVTVPFKSPDDVWILHIDKKQIKHKVGDAKDCKKPTEAPTTPSEKPTGPALPVTGSSMVGVAGVGLSMLGVGALALLIARRRRAL